MQLVSSSMRTGTRSCPQALTKSSARARIIANKENNIMGGRGSASRRATGGGAENRASSPAPTQRGSAGGRSDHQYTNDALNSARTAESLRRQSEKTTDPKKLKTLDKLAKEHVKAASRAYSNVAAHNSQGVMSSVSRNLERSAYDSMNRAITASQAIHERARVAGVKPSSGNSRLGPRSRG